MKTQAIIAALLTAATLAYSQALPVIQYEIEANYQQTQELDSQSFSQGSSVVMHFSLRQGGKWLNLTGLTAAWYGQESATATQRLEQVSATTVTTTTPHYFRIVLDSGATGTARTNWLWSLVVSDATPRSYTIGQGRLDIVAGTWAGPAAVLVTPTVEAYLEARLDGIEGEITTNVIAGLVHSEIGGLGWTESGHTGTAARVAIFSEGGIAGEGTLGTGLTWDGDTINATPTDLTGYATTGTVEEVSAVADAALPRAGGSANAMTGDLYLGTNGVWSTASGGLKIEVVGDTRLTLDGNSGMYWGIGLKGPMRWYAGKSYFNNIAVMDWEDRFLQDQNGANTLYFGQEKQLIGDWTTTGTNTAAAYAYPSNRRAIPETVAIGTNATYEIASANGFRQVLDFGTDTNAFAFTFEGPGAGFEAATHLTVYNYDKRATTWPTNNVVWVPADDFPTNATMSVVIQWFAPTNVTEQITILNTTWDK